MAADITQSVTSRKSDIPQHFIAISSFGCHKGNTDKKASEEYKALYRAWCDERISGVKLMKSVHDKRGQIFVDPVDAERVISEQRQARLRQMPLPAVAKSAGTNGADALRLVENVLIPDTFDCLNAIAGALERTEKLLERLTTAVENIAAHPKAPHQEFMGTIQGNGVWRDMNCEAH